MRDAKVYSCYTVHGMAMRLESGSIRHDSYPPLFYGYC